MRIQTLLSLLLSLVLACPLFGQNVQNNIQKDTKDQLKTYLIERDIPGAGQLTAEDLKGISQHSNAVIAEIGEGIEWMESYISGDKVFCRYRAVNVDLLREHAEKGEFPITSIKEISQTISPATADE